MCFNAPFRPSPPSRPRSYPTSLRYNTFLPLVDPGRHGRPLARWSDFFNFHAVLETILADKYIITPTIRVVPFPPPLPDIFDPTLHTSMIDVF